MDWKTLLADITGTVDQALLLRNEYLATENRILIDEILDVDLHGWTPVRARGMGCRQYTPSSNATTLESKKSDPENR